MGNHSGKGMKARNLCLSVCVAFDMPASPAHPSPLHCFCRVVEGEKHTHTQKKRLLFLMQVFRVTFSAVFLFIVPFLVLRHMHFIDPFFFSPNNCLNVRCCRGARCTFRLLFFFIGRGGVTLLHRLTKGGK